ncbi:transposase domain-containing protein [Pleomorphomonas carboxyditropha]
MKEWWMLSDLAGMHLPGLPPSERQLQRTALEIWKPTAALVRRATGREGGGGYEYHISLLPQEAQNRLRFVADLAALQDKSDDERSALWQRFEGLPEDHKAIARQRHEAVRLVDEVRRSGASNTEAIQLAVVRFGVSRRSIYNWLEMIAGVERSDWLPALAPNYEGNRGEARTAADCHPDAWEALKSDYLRPEKPKFTRCYRRVCDAAKMYGWAPIPSERTLRRKLDAEVTKGAQLVAREGMDAAKTLFPAQRRSRAHFHAMQAVNMDGHKIDLLCSVSWSKKPVRMLLIGIQDLYSNKIVGWRLAEAETWEAVRLVIGDMVEAYGIPDVIYLDNGRAFASKWITGDNVKRFRFKVKPEDPRGLLATLGIEQHFTLPYSGQSKPIERAWGDLAEEIAKHPSMAGAYTGNNPTNKPANYGSRTVTLEELRAHVARCIAEYNARLGRETETAAGRSFNETFEASMADPATIVRRPTAAQRSLWLLASEAITTRGNSGEIHFQGNRYWAPVLTRVAGQKVVIRFDPDHLARPVKVYDLKNRLICEAPCIQAVGFDDMDAARQHMRLRREFLKATKALADAHRALTPAELGEIYDRGQKAAEQPEPVRPAVTRLAVGGPPTVPVDPMSESEFESSFSRALARVSGEAVIPFPQGKKAE